MELRGEIRLRIIEATKFKISSFQVSTLSFLLRFNYDICYGVVEGKLWQNEELKDNNYKCKNNVCLLCGYFQRCYG